MKKVKLCIAVQFFVFLLMFFSTKSYAASWKFLWTNTTVEVPYGDSIEKYKNVPQAKLYKDEVLLTNSKITYNTEGDWLYYFKDINTKKLGDYLVWYKAYDSVNSPGTCTGYKSLITFRVVDLVDPKIEVFSPIYNVKRGSELDLEANYSVSDNCELLETKIIGTVDTMKVGSYPIEIFAKDTSGNETKKEFEVLVYENTAPVITCSLPENRMEVPLSGEIDLKEYFRASDSVEGDITSKLYFPPMENLKVGETKYIVSVTNDAQLTTDYEITLVVIDDVVPTIELTTHSLLLDYQEDLDSIAFDSYIKKISDNQNINYENLKITHNLKNKVGSYKIKYSYTDGIYTVEEYIDVTMASSEKPSMKANTVRIAVDDTVDLSDYISVSDPSDPNVVDSLEIYDTKVDYSTPGTYYAEAYCINSSGISNTLKFKIVVYEDAKTVEKIEAAYDAGLDIEEEFEEVDEDEDDSTSTTTPTTTSSTKKKKNTTTEKESTDVLSSITTTASQSPLMIALLIVGSLLVVINVIGLFRKRNK